MYRQRWRCFWLCNEHSWERKESPQRSLMLKTKLQYTRSCHSKGSWMCVRPPLGLKTEAARVWIWRGNVSDLVFSIREWGKSLKKKHHVSSHSWHSFTIFTWFESLPSIHHHPSAGSVGVGSGLGWGRGLQVGSSLGLAHDRWLRWWDCCWVWATLCVWDLPAKVGQKGTPTARLFVIPCMALCGSLGSASSFSQE